MRRTILVLTLVLCAAPMLGGCAPDLRAGIEAAGVFSPRRVDVGNDELVTLGQLLFFDRELSGNRDVSCATCHLPPMHAGDACAVAVGEDGARLSRNTIEPFNRGAATSFFWDGRLALEGGEIVSPVPLPGGLDTLLEAQVLLPLLDRREMRGQPGDVALDGRANELATISDDAPEEIWAAIVLRILAFDEYRERFARAFPDIPVDEITIVQVAIAVAAFESRLWELTDTPFDDFLGSVSEPGDDAALGEWERRGASLFFGDAGCVRCHDGPLLGDDDFHAIGVPQIGPGRDGAFLDEGRFLVTGDPADRFAFRTPPLRNVALTSPYMHDGAYDRLEDAVRHHLDPEAALRGYAGTHLPADLQAQVRREATDAIAEAIDPEVIPYRPLTDDEVVALVAFLGALSSRTELAVPPEAGIPASVPSGLEVDRPRLGPDTIE